jgi:hypothetical protein
MFHYLKQIVFEVAPYSLGPPLLLGIWLFRIMPAAGKIICLHVLFAALTELTADLLGHYGINNLFLLHIYTVEECGMILWFYSYVFLGFINRKVFLYTFLSFFALAVINSVFFQSLTQNNTYSRGIEATIIILCSIGYFYKMLGEPKIEKPEQSPYFWFNTGFLIYFSASLLLFTLSNYILGAKYKQLRMDIWVLHAFFSILLYSFIAIGLWKYRKR